MYKTNHDLIKMILEDLPEDRKKVLTKALDRNFYLTSVWTLSWADLYVYEEGFYLELSGTRAKFSVWVYDNDGNFEYGRKPVDSKLHLIYKDSGPMDEDMYDVLR